MFPERRRRGRKRKAEKMAEIAMAEALARREQARVVAGIEPGMCTTVMIVVFLTLLEHMILVSFTVYVLNLNPFNAE